MINFRFHLVSLIAVFLALALGVVVGSTVIDRAIVDGLEAQIDRVERNAEAQRSENGDLRRKLDDLQKLADQMAPFTVRGDRLLDVPIVVFAARGVDEDGARSLLNELRAEGGLAPAVLWLERRWSLAEAADRETLADLVDVDRAPAEELQAAALQALAARVAAGVPDGVDSSTPDLLAALMEHGFLGVDVAGGPGFDPAVFPGAGARVVLMSSPDSDVPGETVVVPLASSLVDAGLLTLVAGFGTPSAEEAPPSVVDLVRSDGALADRLSTVDDSASTSGRMAVVLGLEELGRGGHGHYGVSSGASRRLPQPAGA